MNIRTDRPRIFLTPEKQSVRDAIEAAREKRLRRDLLRGSKGEKR